MPKGVPISDDLKLDICELIEKGLPRTQIARDLHICPATVSRVKKELYGKDIRSMDTVVAGNKKYGTLTATGPNHYVGTCLVKGKMKRKHFNVCGSKEAIQQWEEWKKKFDENVVPVEMFNSDESEETVEKTPVINTNCVYILAVGNPKIAGWFENEAEAKRAMNAANKALEFAGVDIRYSVVKAVKDVM